MALLNTYNSTNQVHDGKERMQETIEGVVYNVTIERYRYVGMTQSAAETAAAAITNPATDTYANWHRVGDSGAFEVSVNVRTQTEA